MTASAAADHHAAVLNFWFSSEVKAKWFVKDPDFDAAIREAFLADYERVAGGDLDGWPATPEDVLALVLLLDQFPRNMFRDHAQAFATDEAARAMAVEAVAHGHDRALDTERRRFLYLPLMHSESLDDQRHCVDLFILRGDDPEALEWAVRHLKIVRRFGRFPHRNAVLGRETTAEEAEFLAEPGSTF